LVHILYFERKDIPAKYPGPEFSIQITSPDQPNPRTLLKGQCHEMA
jgi:hypothetical protein